MKPRSLRSLAQPVKRLLQQVQTGVRLRQYDLNLVQQRFNDWAQLNVYREANAQLIASPPDPQRVVFFGDSITDFWNLAAYFPGKPYINRGICGQTTPQMLVRFRPDVIALQPKIVVILAGTNDIAGNTGAMTLEMIQDNLTSIVELAKVHRIRVVLSSILPVHDAVIVQSDSRSAEQIDSLNHWLKTYCAANNEIYLDYYSHLIDVEGRLRSHLSDDGLHPNDRGYEMMAPLAAAAIEQALLA